METTLRHKPFLQKLPRSLVRVGLLSPLFLIGSLPVLFGGAAAQGASQPLEFDVRPSGVEEETAEDRLNRRLRQREYLFRSICIQCGPGDRFQSSAPFNPQDALRKPARD
jgi:hypothetical protein